MIAKISKRKYITFFVISLLGLLTAMLYFKPFSSTEILVLDHLTSHNRDSTIIQICLVKNQPTSSKKLNELIRDFNQKNQTESGNFDRLFIKKHNYMFFPELIFRKNIDYSAKKTTRSDLDNIDFLATSSSFLNVDGNRISRLKVNVGEIWYYKK